MTRQLDLQSALKIVAEDMRELAHGIYKGPYASHVTEEDKIRFLEKDLAYADEVEKGLHNCNLSIRQRITYVMTGETVAILPMY